jgi:hypothetical protein
MESILSKLKIEEFFFLKLDINAFSKSLWWMSFLLEITKSLNSFISRLGTRQRCLHFYFSTHHQRLDQWNKVKNETKSRIEMRNILSLFLNEIIYMENQRESAETISSNARVWLGCQLQQQHIKMNSFPLFWEQPIIN